MKNVIAVLVGWASGFAGWQLFHQGPLAVFCIGFTMTSVVLFCAGGRD